MDWIEVKGDGSVPADMSQYKVWQYKLRKGYVIVAGPTNDHNFFLHHGEPHDVVAVKPREVSQVGVYSKELPEAEEEIRRESWDEILLRELSK